MLESNFEKFIKGKINFLRENDLNVLFKEEFKSETNDIIKLYKLPYVDIDGIEYDDIVIYFNLNNKPIFIVDNEDVYITPDILPKAEMKFKYTLVEKFNYYNIYSTPKILQGIKNLIYEINVDKSIQYVDYLAQIGEKRFLDCKNIEIDKNNKEESAYNWVKGAIISSAIKDNQKIDTISDEILDRSLNFNRIGTQKNSKFYRILLSDKKLFSMIIKFNKNLEKLKEELELDFDIAFKNDYHVEPLAFYFRKAYQIYKEAIKEEISKDIYVQKAKKIYTATKSKNCKFIKFIINSKFICHSNFIVEYENDKLSCFFEKENGDLIFADDIENIICNGEVIFENKDFIEEMKELNLIENDSNNKIPF